MTKFMQLGEITRNEPDLLDFKLGTLALQTRSWKRIGN